MVSGDNEQPWIINSLGNTESNDYFELDMQHTPNFTKRKFLFLFIGNNRQIQLQSDVNKTNEESHVKDKLQESKEREQDDKVNPYVTNRTGTTSRENLTLLVLLRT